MIKNHVLVFCLVLLSTFGFSQKIYIAENGSQLIQRSNLDGTSLDPVSSAGQVGPIRDIVIDQIKNIAYWIEATSPTIIRRAALESNAGGVQLGTPSDFVNVSSPPTNFQSLAINPITRELLVANIGDIVKLSLDATSTFVTLPAPLISGQSLIPGFDIDLINNKIYLIRSITTREIRIVNLDGTGPVTTIVPNSLFTESMKDIVVDPTGGRFYYSNENPVGPVGEIVARDLSTGSNPVTIVTSLASSIRGIAIDIDSGLIFWADGFSKIGKANLDGSNAIDIVPGGLDAPLDVALDLNNPNPPKVYWSENVGGGGGDDEIHRVGLDGSDFEVPYSGFSDEISGLEIDETNNYVYWTDAAKAEIFRGLIGETNLSTNEKLIDFNPSSAAGLFDIALDIPNNTIYYTHGNAETGFTNKISKADVSAPDPNTTVVEIIDTGLEEPFGIDLDLANGKIYYITNRVTTGTSRQLYRADLDGGNVELVYSTGSPDVEHFRDVKIDPVNELVYWTSGEEDTPLGTIFYNDINEAAPFASPSSFTFGGEPWGLDLDLFNDKIYWVCRGASDGAVPPAIMQSDLDGSNIINLFNITVFPSGFPPAPPGSSFIALDLRGLASPTLALTGTTATKNETNVAINANITLSFDQDVAASSVNSNTIIVRGEQTGIINGVLSGGGTSTLTFDPTNDFKAGEVIRVTITNNLQSTGGGNLTAPYFFSFVATAGAAPESPAYFEQQPSIANNFNGVIGVFPVDMDGDGDMDVVSAAGQDDKVSWFENDGSQNFTERVIATGIDEAKDVEAADMDNDGDIDVVSVSTQDDRVVWYENDGSQNFTTRVISSAADGAFGVHIADINSDGFLDVLSASVFDNKIAWYENDGSQNFTTRIISTTTTGALQVTSADLDGDGDVDVLAAAETASTVFWFENDGSASFTQRVVSTNFSEARDVNTIDLDQDGDVDVLTASEADDKIAWFENDGSQNFIEHVVTTIEDAANSVSAADLDGDGDIDLLSTGNNSGEFAWYENDGAQNFTRIVIVDVGNFAFESVPVDLDGDGDLDIVGAWSLGDEIVWFENTIDVCAGQSPLIAGSPSFTTDIDTPITVDVIAASTINNGDIIQVIIETQSNNGTLVINNDNTITYQPDAGYSGNDTFDYSITNQCGLTDSNTVSIVVNATPPPTSILVYNGLSPNGDSFNPYFRIENIEVLEPNNKVTIYNRWGDKVFEVDNYENGDPTRRFNGESDNGKDLPSGVYFYKIIFVSGSPELTGYLTLKR
ncbi:MAG: FG-GAP-like repeat-containing protein [Cyclobacteriaceae bacterium]